MTPPKTKTIVLFAFALVLHVQLGFDSLNTQIVELVPCKQSLITYGATECHFSDGYAKTCFQNVSHSDSLNYYWKVKTGGEWLHTDPVSVSNTNRTSSQQTAPSKYELGQTHSGHTTYEPSASAIVIRYIATALLLHTFV